MTKNEIETAAAIRDGVTKVAAFAALILALRLFAAACTPVPRAASAPQRLAGSVAAVRG